MKSVKPITKTRIKPQPARPYTIGSEGEMREVRMLIEEGVYKNVDEYLYKSALSLYGPKKKKAS